MQGRVFRAGESILYTGHMIQAVLFDFFGVLHPDTFWGLADVLEPERSEERTRELRDLIRQANYGLLSRDQLWRATAETYGISFAELQAEKAKLGGVDQHLLELIRTLKTRGMKTAILSNVGLGFMEQALAPEVRTSYFDALILSGEEGVTKPDAQIYEIAAQRLGVRPEDCLFFDDIQRNVDGATAVGMQAVLYEGIASCKHALAAASVVL